MKVIDQGRRNHWRKGGKLTLLFSPPILAQLDGKPSPSKDPVCLPVLPNRFSDIIKRKLRN